jgi:hypothetical protein
VGTILTFDRVEKIEESELKEPSFDTGDVKDANKDPQH